MHMYIVECRYNAVEHNMILHTLYCNTALTAAKISELEPSQNDVFCEEKIDRVISVLHYI